MDIFVSWAGRDGHAAAFMLRRWLPEVLSFTRPWVSSDACYFDVFDSL